MRYEVEDVDLTGRAFVFSVYDAGSFEQSFNAEIINGVAYWVINGSHSTAFYKLGTTLNYDFTERLRDETRETIFTGILTVDRTTATIASLSSAPLGRVIAAITHKFDPAASGAPDIAINYGPYGTVTQPGASAPVFIIAPAITGTATVGQTLTGGDGTITDGSASARQWVRNGTAISGATGSSYKLGSADNGASIAFRVTASGSGGTTVATSSARTVTPAQTVSGVLFNRLDINFSMSAVTWGGGSTPSPTMNVVLSGAQSINEGNPSSSNMTVTLSGAQSVAEGN